MSQGDDELFFYAGATAPVGCGMTCLSTTNKGAFLVSFNVNYRGIYLLNGAGTAVASSTFLGESAWETVSISYTRGTTNTWVVAWKGAVVITYSDQGNADWVLQAGSYWGFGARDGGGSGDFSISQVQLLLAPSMRKCIGWSYVFGRI